MASTQRSKKAELGGGNNSVFVNPRRAASSHAARKATGMISRDSERGDRGPSFQERGQPPGD